MIRDYQVINHTADIGIRASGHDLAEAMANTARGMFSLITDLRKVRPVESTVIRVSGIDRSELLVAWLNELIFQFETERRLFRQFKIVEISSTSLVAEVRGEKIDKKRHSLKRGIKSATYHRLKIEPEERGCRIQVLLDI